MKEKVSAREVLSTYFRLWGYHEKRIFVYWICVVLNGASMYCLVAANGVLLSSITKIASGTAPANVVAIMVGIMVLSFAVVAISGFLPAVLTYLQERAGNKLRTLMIKNRSSMLETVAGKISDSDVFLRINDDLSMALDTIGAFGNMAFFNPILSGLFSFTTIGIIDWRLGAFTLVFALVICAPLGVIRRKTADLQLKIQKQKARLAQQYADTLGGKEEIKIFGMKPWMMHKILDISLNAFQAQSRFYLWYHGRGEWFSFGYFMNLVGLVALGSYLAIQGVIPFAAVMITLPLSGQVMQMVQGIGRLWAFICERSAPTSRVFEVIDLAQENLEYVQDCNLELCKACIEFENVSFSYSEGTPVLKNVTFAVKDGQSVAFVGESGCGKSTILRLLMGLYKPATGNIRVCGNSIDQIGLARWRKQFAYIQQDTSLFNVSIRKNISLDRELTNSEIAAAAELAGADDFICENPKGYDQVAGENGTNLSGGERQRVVIARGIAANAPIILMDEPTSALDRNIERIVQKTVRELHGKRTIVMVSHRLEFSADCDLICFMNKGEIVEFGSHQELLEKMGDYYALWNVQKNEKEKLANC